ncbi:hypothetical protein BASA81_005894 [Batrachochytrium salamandrivorans]|nr:hypothetical protein BASA81_005894 [Batrachochytrium salamandrivorans]
MDKSIACIQQSVKALVVAAKHVDNDSADQVCLEILLHSHLLVENVESMLNLVDELKLSRVLMDWKAQDKVVCEEIRQNLAREKRDRTTVKLVVDEVRQLEQEIGQHLGLSRTAKRTKFA